MPIEIRRMEECDLQGAAQVHCLAFPRQQQSGLWIQCNFRAFPRMQLFVALEDGEVIGFILWTQKSGFRPQTVLELEQIAVRPDHQEQGIGEKLITESLSTVRRQLTEVGFALKSVLVTTRIDNQAQRLYQKALGAESVAIIQDLYSGDEVLMLRRFE